MATARPGQESDFVWNVIFTPDTFRYFQYFTRSLAAMAGARFRLVANGCGLGDVGAMHAFAAGDRDRFEVFALPGDDMIPHGRALDALFDATDDGAYFCFLDSDVKATDRYMPELIAALRGADLVTSCGVAWTDDIVLPAGSRDLVGRHFLDHDGFVYGSSYLALYRRAAVEAVRTRWAVTFTTYAFAQLSSDVQARLQEIGRVFDLYDTAKVLNILLQDAGFRARHVDEPALFHVGGISSYLSYPERGTGRPPWYGVEGTGRVRWDFAQWAAYTLMALVDGGRPPDVLPEGIDRSLATTTRAELTDLVERYRDG